MNLRFQFIVFNAVCALVSHVSVMADTPLLQAVHEIHQPTHQVPNEWGWSNYDGNIYANEDYIIIYVQYDDETELISGVITVLDRWSLKEMGVLRPDSSENLSGWGRNIALSGHRLAVAAGANSGDIHVYDLSAAGFPKLYSMTGCYGLSSMVGLEAPEPLWLISTATQTSAYRMNDGSYCGVWDLPMGSLSAVDGAWMLTTVPSQQWNGIAEYFFANFAQSGAVVDLRQLPEIEPEYDEFYAWQRDGLILILSGYRGTAGSWNNFYAYDPTAGSIVWQKQHAEGWWYDPVVTEGRIFIENDADGLDVYDVESGLSLAVLESPVSGTVMFGHNVSEAKGLVFVSAINQLFVYDSASLEFLYELDIQGHVDLDSGFAQEVEGVEDVVFLYNLNNPIMPMYNSWYRNPQVILVDVSTGQLTRQLSLRQAVTVGDVSNRDPRSFPITIFDAGRGCLGVRSGFGSYGAPYQVFDPALFSEGCRNGVVAAVAFKESLGFSYELSRQAGGSSAVLTTVVFGEEHVHSIDVPMSHRGDGIRYLLREQEVVHIVDDYEQPLPPLDEVVSNSVTGDSVSRYYTVASDASYAIVSDIAQSGYPMTRYSGKVSVVDLATGQIHFSLLPESSQAGKGFGNRAAFSDDYLAIGDIQEAATSVYNLQSGALVKMFGGGEAFALGQDCLVRLVKSGSGAFLLTCNDLPSGQVRFSVPVNYDQLYDWIVPDLNLSGDYIVMELQVFDLATGAYRYTLASPNPEPDDYFGTRVAGDDGKFVAISASQATGYLFDLADGTHEQTFLLPEWPSGYSNYAAGHPTLTLNLASGVFVWGTPFPGSDSAIHLFDISSGRRICKVVSPLEYLQIGGEISSLATHAIGEGMAVSGDELWFYYKERGRSSVARMDFASLRGHSLIDRTQVLFPDLFLEISVSSRSDIIYQSIQGESLAALTPTGDDELRGTGNVLTKRFSIPESVKTWFAAFRIRWADPDGEF